MVPSSISADHGRFAPFVEVLAAVVLTFLLLGPIGLRPVSSPDEARYAVGRTMLGNGDWVTPTINGVPFLDKPPLHYWMDAISFAMFGVHAWSLRLPGALLALLGCGVVWVAGARWFDRSSGMIAAIVLGSSLAYAGGSQYANMDLEVAVLIGAAIVCGTEALRDGARVPVRWAIAGAVFAAAATLDKGLIGIVLPTGSLVLWRLVSKPRGIPRRAWHHIGIAAIVYLALALPWFFAIQAATPQFFDHFIVGQHVERFLGEGRAVDFHNRHPSWVMVAFIAASLLPWTVFLPMALREGLRRDTVDPRERTLVVLVVCWFAFCAVFLAIPRTKVIGYALPATIPCALLIGRYWSRRCACGDGPSRTMLAAALLPFAMVSIVALVVPGSLRTHAEALGAMHVLVEVGIAALAAVVIGLVLGWRRDAKATLAALVIGCILLYGTGLHLAGVAMLANNAAPIVERMRGRIQSSDTVVTYRTYVDELLFYLDRDHVVVADDWTRPQWSLSMDNWRRHLFLGLGMRPSAAQWLIQEDALPRRCPSEVRCWIFVRRENSAALEKLMDGSVRQAAHQGDLLLYVTSLLAPSGGIPPLP